MATHDDIRELTQSLDPFLTHLQQQLRDAEDPAEKAQAAADIQAYIQHPGNDVSKFLDKLAMHARKLEMADDPRIWFVTNRHQVAEAIKHMLLQRPDTDANDYAEFAARLDIIPARIDWMLGRIEAYRRLREVQPQAHARPQSQAPPRTFLDHLRVHGNAEDVAAYLAEHTDVLGRLRQLLVCLNGLEWTQANRPNDYASEYIKVRGMSHGLPVEDLLPMPAFDAHSAGAVVARLTALLPEAYMLLEAEELDAAEAAMHDSVSEVPEQASTLSAPTATAAATTTSSTPRSNFRPFYRHVSDAYNQMINTFKREGIRTVFFRKYPNYASFWRFPTLEIEMGACRNTRRMIREARPADNGVDGGVVLSSALLLTDASRSRYSGFAQQTTNWVDAVFHNITPDVQGRKLRFVEVHGGGFGDHTLLFIFDPSQQRLYGFDSNGDRSTPRHIQLIGVLGGALNDRGFIGWRYHLLDNKKVDKLAGWALHDVQLPDDVRGKLRDNIRRAPGRCTIWAMAFGATVAMNPGKTVPQVLAVLDSCSDLQRIAYATAHMCIAFGNTKRPGKTKTKANAKQRRKTKGNAKTQRGKPRSAATNKKRSATAMANAERPRPAKKPKAISAVSRAGQLLLSYFWGGRHLDEFDILLRDRIVAEFQQAYVANQVPYWTTLNDSLDLYQYAGGRLPDAFFDALAWYQKNYEPGGTDEFWQLIPEVLRNFDALEVDENEYCLETIYSQLRRLRQLYLAHRAQIPTDLHDVLRNNPEVTFASGSVVERLENALSNHLQPAPPAEPVMYNICL